MTYLRDPLPPSPLLERLASCSPVESLLCSSLAFALALLLLEQTSSIGSDLTSSTPRARGEGVRLPSFSLIEMPLPLLPLLPFALPLPELPALPLPAGPLPVCEIGRERDH